MTLVGVRHLCRIFVYAGLTGGAALLAGCTTDTGGVSVAERQERAKATAETGAGESTDAEGNWLTRVVAKAVPGEGEPSGYKIGKPYQIAGRWFTPRADASYDEVGAASWYGADFHGRTTANGEIFDADALTAAHPTLPLPSYVRVTNLENDRSIVVRVNDRGPFARNRLIDVSRRTAELLGFKHNGNAKVRVQYVDKARLDGNDREFLLASYRGPDADVWGGAVQTAAAEAPAARPARAVRVAAASPAPAKASPPQAPEAVAFAETAEASGPGAGAYQAVTTPFEPGNRISMAFEMASQAEY